MLINIAEGMVARDGDGARHAHGIREYFNYLINIFYYYFKYIAKIGVILR